MAVGLPMKTTYANGDVFSSSDVNDITGTVNLVGQTNNFYAGKNKIINGDFGVWQRGTSFTVTSQVYTSDRWLINQSGAGSPTTSQQTFTPGTAPVSGYNGTYFLRMANAVGTTYCEIQQRIEDVRVFAGQSVTLSFWAKATSSITMQPLFRQNFGTGGSSSVDTNGSTVTLTSSWVRYTVSVTIPSISGKTIGNNTNRLEVYLYSSGGTVASNSVDIWGVQLESGSTATAFQTATGTIQGELAACQRYYWNISGNNQYVGVGYNQSTTEMNVGIVNPVAMRTTPTLTVATGTDYYGFKRNGADDNFNSLTGTASFASVTGQMLYNSTEISGTAGQAGTVRTNNASAKIEFSAEL